MKTRRWGVHGIGTQDRRRGRMKDTDEPTEHYWPHKNTIF